MKVRKTAYFVEMQNEKLRTLILIRVCIEYISVYVRA